MCAQESFRTRHYHKIPPARFHVKSPSAKVFVKHQHRAKGLYSCRCSLYDGFKGIIARSIGHGDFFGSLHLTLTRNNTMFLNRKRCVFLLQIQSSDQAYDSKLTLSSFEHSSASRDIPDVSTSDMPSLVSPVSNFVPLQNHGEIGKHQLSPTCFTLASIRVPMLDFLSPRKAPRAVPESSTPLATSSGLSTSRPYTFSLHSKSHSTPSLHRDYESRENSADYKDSDSLHFICAGAGRALATHTAPNGDRL